MNIRELFKTIGIDTVDENGIEKNIFKILDEVAEFFENMPQEEKDKANEINNKLGLPDVVALSKLIKGIPDVSKTKHD